jgi:5-(carboxyamino)imidazole ribonucleotide synthase
LRSSGIPVTPFWPVYSPEKLPSALDESRFPAVLKTAAWGYDGKGQAIVDSAVAASRAAHRFGSQELIVEAFIDFACDFSCRCSRRRWQHCHL